MKITPRKGGKKKPKSEQNVEMQVARGRLKGLLNEIMEEPDTADPPPKVTSNRGRPRRPKDDGSSSTSNASKPYVIKLFDRLVNVSQFDENSPLYPICREWFYDKKTEKVAESPSGDSTPTYYTGKEPLLKQLQKARIDRVAALPPPNDDEVVQKVPYCEPPALENGLNLFSVDYDWDNPTVATEDLTASYMDRWRKVRQAWNLQSHHYFQRYAASAKVFEAIKKN